MLTIVKKNDSYDAITYQLENEDNSTVDLTGASVNFVMGKKNKLITNAKATVTSATSGIVSYQLTPLDTLVSGTFLAEFVVTFANGTTKTYPSNGYITVDVEQNLDTSQNNVVLDMIATKQGDFEAKLDSILKQGTGTPVSAMNEYTWTATSGQTIFVFPTSAKYDPSAKWFQVSVGNVPIANELINRASSSQFSLVVDPSLIVTGMTVHAMWVEPIVPITGGHHITHEINGQDEINIANLRNYQELVATPIASNTTALADITSQSAIKISDYGAHSIDEVGYSTFDSSSAINAAIQAAVSSPTRKAVDFGSGRYYAVNITLASGINYFSTRGAELITLPSASFGNTCLVKGTNLSNVKIFGLTLNGNKGVVPGNVNDGTTLLLLSGCTQVHVQNCYLYNNEYGAIRIVDGCNNIHVLDNEIYNTDCAIMTQGIACNQLELANNVIHVGSSDGIVMYCTNGTSQNVVIEGNMVYGKTGGNGIILQAVKNLTVSNNVLNGNASGINIKTPNGTTTNGVDNATIIGNTISNSVTGPGIVAKYLTNSLIESNNISNVYQNGITMQNSDNNTIQNNNIVNCNLQKLTFYPLVLTSSNNNIAKQNVIRDNNSPINHTQTIVVNSDGTTPSDNNFLIGNIGFNSTPAIFLIQSNCHNNICVDNVGGGYPIDQGTGTIIVSNRKTNGQFSTVTISSGTVSINNGFEYQKFSASAAQSVTTINGGTFAGQKIIVLFADVNTTLVNTTGNLRLNGNFTPTSVNASITLMYNGTNWQEVSRSNF
jgi:parallel beta-helix repeat protein